MAGKVIPLNRAERQRQRKKTSRGSAGDGPPPKCKAQTKAGTRCTRNAATPDGYCRLHSKPTARQGRRPLLKQMIGRREDGSEITVEDRILESLRAGAYLSDAAESAGVGYSTVKEWIARGEEFTPDGNADKTPDEQLADLPDRERLYASFAAACARARAQARVSAVAQIRKAGQEDWRAAAWFLERTRPRDFARVTRGVIASDAGDMGGVTLAELAAMADDVEGDP